MTKQGEVRDWKKDMELCQQLNQWYEHPWEVQEDGSRAIDIYEIIPDETFNYVATFDDDLTTNFFMESRQALPYWLQQAVEWKARAYEAEVKAAAEKELANELRDDASRWEAKAEKLARELAAAEAREKKLREAIEEALSWTLNCGEYTMTEVIAILRGVLASLYPEEGEAK